MIRLFLEVLQFASPGQESFLKKQTCTLQVHTPFSDKLTPTIRCTPASQVFWPHAVILPPQRLILTGIFPAA